MPTEITSRSGIVSSIDIYSFRFSLVELTNYTLRVIDFKRYFTESDKRWSITKLPEPIESTRSAYTPDTKPKTTRYLYTLSKSDSVRYIFTPVNGFGNVNSIDLYIAKEYISKRDCYYELHIASKRNCVISLLSHATKTVFVNVENYDDINTIDTLIASKRISERFIFIEDTYLSNRFVITPTVGLTDRKVHTVLPVFSSLNTLEIGIAQRFNSTRKLLTISDNGQIRYVVFDVSSGNHKFTKRLAYWQPKPRHYTERKILYKLPNYSSLNTVLIYEGTKYWQDRYIYTDWFIYNSVRHIHTRYKVATQEITIGSSNSDVLYSKDKAGRCFKFTFTHHSIKDFSIFDKDGNLKKFDKCNPISFVNITKFGFHIPHNDEQNFKATYHIDAYGKDGSTTGETIKHKRYQINLYIKETITNDRMCVIKS